MLALMERDEHGVWHHVGTTPHEEFASEFLDDNDPDDADPHRRVVDLD